MIRLTFFLSLFIMQSCWFPCAPSINGTVKDKATGNMLDSVEVSVYEGNDLIATIYTDSLGRFWTGASSKSRFMLNECESGFKLLLKKTEYVEQNFVGVAPAVNIEIEMEQ